VRKAAGQLVWHPEDQIELAKRLGVIHYGEGRSAEGAAGGDTRPAPVP
jgi:hypothetical protein